MTFSIFVRISPSGKQIDMLPRPDVKRVGDVVTIELPYWDDGKGYWLILAQRRLGVNEQNFRDLVLSKFWEQLQPSTKATPYRRAEIVSIEVLRPAPRMMVFGSKNKRIVVRLPLEHAVRAYIYHDFALPVLDGGFYWTIDVPSYLI